MKIFLKISNSSKYAITNSLDKRISNKCNRMQRFIKMGTNSSVLLLSLVEDILDLSKIEGGTFKINMVRFKPTELIDEVNDIFIYQCEQKGLKLDIDVSQELCPIEIYSDKGRIKQILLNLISNSLKFTFKGGICIKASILRLKEKSFVRFWVKDTGIGIKEKDQGKLFKLFGMIEDNNQLNPNGWGIGLTVSKKYVEKLGGEIKLKSRFGKGTIIIFTVELNLPPVNNRFEENKNSDLSVESTFIPEDISPIDRTPQELDKFTMALAYTNKIKSPSFQNIPFKLLKY